MSQQPPSNKFFLDADTRAELRAVGLVPHSPLALRLVRLGAILLLLGLYEFSFAKLSQGDALAPFLLLGALPLAAILLLSASETRLYLSGTPRRREPTRYPITVTAICFVVCIGIFASLIASQLQGGSLTWILSLVIRLKEDPATVWETAQHLLVVTGVLGVVTGLIASGIGILTFHLRYRDGVPKVDQH
jgi:hypothetical protein